MADEKRSTINVRLGEALLQAIRMEAARNANSMNAEIVNRLADSLIRPREDAGEIDPTSLSIDEAILIRILRKASPRQRFAFFDFASTILTVDPDSAT